MNTIQIDENWRAQYDGTQYTLERWDAGGREARNPKSGETIQTQAKWVNQGRYFTAMQNAVEFVAKSEASESASNLKEFVELQNDWLKKITKLLEGARPNAS